MLVRLLVQLLQDDSTKPLGELTGWLEDGMILDGTMVSLYMSPGSYLTFSVVECTISDTACCCLVEDHSYRCNTSKL